MGCDEVSQWKMMWSSLIISVRDTYNYLLIVEKYMYFMYFVLLCFYICAFVLVHLYIRVFYVFVHLRVCVFMYLCRYNSLT